MPFENPEPTTPATPIIPKSPQVPNSGAAKVFWVYRLRGLGSLGGSSRSRAQTRHPVTKMANSLSRVIRSITSLLNALLNRPGTFMSEGLALQRPLDPKPLTSAFESEPSALR